MKNVDPISLLADRQFLDKLYTYAYRRCSTSCEAEDLCSDIILAVLKALRQGGEIQHFYAFTWTIAHRVYADYCENRKKESARLIPAQNPDGTPSEADSLSLNPIEDLLLEEAQRQNLQEIFREISFLSRIYRKVMVMYYLEEHKISDIAASLGITETTVKQRLFSARGTIKKEIHKMKNSNQNINRTLQPVSLFFHGDGNPNGNNPSQKAERILSQNLVYLCKSEAKSAGELARELNVPMPYIEQELEIQCHGLNGSYGLLRKTQQGKYISNILIIDRDEYIAAGEIYQRYVQPFCSCLTAKVQDNRERILAAAPVGHKDMPLLLWRLTREEVWDFSTQVKKELADYFSDVPLPQRPFTTLAVADYGDQVSENLVYGCDGIQSEGIYGYSRVIVQNMYGPRLQAHFHCGHNISNDPLLLLTIRCADGLPLSSLSEQEQEIAARAIQCGYLRKNGNSLEPAILVFSGSNDPAGSFLNVLGHLSEEACIMAHTLAGELAEFMKKHIPPHLMGEYRFYHSAVTSGFFHNVAEECIRSGILNAPENPLGPEGVLMILEK